MKKLTSILTAMAMSVGMLSAGAVPATSAPLAPISIETGTPNVQTVRDRGRHWRHGGDRGWRGNRHWRGDRGWRGDRHWRGHRGYRHHRSGYRYHNGAWFPLAAFGTGVIIGSTVNRPAYRGVRSHTQWCYDRYRSYRASDNTFQPNNGPRRQCNSPY
ncbi:BA14K family protein [Phyllobacterium sp. SB3]|uniref:BA14K family protein n=1 Tax=Phyllobacterium sp. SB3 TaxID=3156073 RepID=UPI0032AF020D